MEKDSFDIDGTMLFRVSQVGIQGKEFRVEQVNEPIRIGRILSKVDVTIVKEGLETQSFWTALGGKKSYLCNTNANKSRLFTIENQYPSSSKAIEIFDVQQKNL